jgi:hypothetical protein
MSADPCKSVGSCDMTASLTGGVCFLTGGARIAGWSARMRDRRALRGGSPTPRVWVAWGTTWSDG